MIIALIVVVVLALLALCYWHSLQENANIIAVQDEFFGNSYKEDIDFSLAVKGYPVVTDMDIAYGKWLMKNPDRIKV